eukprot:CAMPEP_0196740102 /NCGR_PEP_ID=MMETSP1091-20130531/29047_1 /TAXON_ID=302021 /ORGANISM="Rhodomonas sp., Strain CCMP768" /LENGTH=173 /DNA_ID=CAMNT_0042085039 /DNA_START=141 /DNA_END=659 /DNA_ORIENTATION=-
MEEVPWSPKRKGHGKTGKQQMHVKESMESAPSSPALSAADTMSRRSSPPGSPNGLFTSPKSMSLREMKVTPRSTKKCSSCDAVCDIHTTTCEVCGEETGDVWVSTARARVEAFNRAWREQPAETFEKDKVEILWSTGTFKIRCPNGGSRAVTVPVLQKVGDDLLPASSKGGMW